MDYLKIKELYHHGIEGQKWGVRNGPPYPLPYSAHTPIEKRENKKSIIDNYSDKKRKLKDKYKRTLAEEKAKTKLLVKVNKKYNKIDEKNEKELLKREKKMLKSYGINQKVHDNAITRFFDNILNDKISKYNLADQEYAKGRANRILENKRIMSMTLEELKEKNKNY